MNRRAFAATLAAGFAGSRSLLQASPLLPTQASSSTGKLTQGVTRNTFGTDPMWTMEEICRQVAPLGIKGFDFALAPDFPVLKKYGMVCSLYRPPAGGGAGAPGAGRGDAAPGPNRGGGAPGAARGGNAQSGWQAMGTPAAMGAYRTGILDAIDLAAANGIPNVFLHAGVRSDTVDYVNGADNTVTFCNAVKGRAEEKGVTLCMEILNSKGFNAPANSLFDHMAWGVDVCKRVNSPRVKILYDIFHAQLMDGNIVQTMRDNIQFIGHVHTGGVPGRNELDGTQELNYAFIARELVAMKYTGFVTHEWRPSAGKNPIDSLKQAIEIMRV